MSCCACSGARVDSVLRLLENVIRFDAGNRGIRKLWEQNGFHLESACRRLLNSSSILLATGFPAFGTTETDGPPGMLALTDALLRLDKKVTFVTDEFNGRIIRNSLADLGLLDKLRAFVVFPSYDEVARAELAAAGAGSDAQGTSPSWWTRFTANERASMYVSLFDDKSVQSWFARKFPHSFFPGTSGDASGEGLSDHDAQIRIHDAFTAAALPTSGSVLKSPFAVDLLAGLEKVSASSLDGEYYSMRARSVSLLCGRVDQMFAIARNNYHLPTIGVGDGGNEIGMGNVLNAVKENVTHGATIGTNVEVDDLIVAGVSNWGGYAMCAGMYAIQSLEASCGSGDRGLWIPTPADELKWMKVIVGHGAADGCTGEREPMSVDALPIDGIHAAILLSLNYVARTASSGIPDQYTRLQDYSFHALPDAKDAVAAAGDKPAELYDEFVKQLRSFPLA